MKDFKTAQIQTLNEKSFPGLPFTPTTAQKFDCCRFDSIQGLCCSLIFITHDCLHLSHVGTAHSGPVRGVAVDGLNQVAMTTSSDQKVKFWHFREKKLLQEVDVQCPVSQMKLHRERFVRSVHWSF